VSGGGLGNGVKQQQMLTQLRVAQQPDRVRIAAPFGERSERGLDSVSGKQH
jgi:hypothetical protein